MEAYLVMKIEEISSLMTSDWVKLRSTLHALDNRQFLCDECLIQYQGRTDYDAMTEASRKVKACEIEAPTPRFQVDSIRYRRCVGNFVSEQAMHYVELHSFFAKHGTLPYPGALVDQPNKLMEIFRVIQNHRHEYEKQAAKESARKQQVRGKRGG